MPELELDGVSVHYRDEGEGSPLLLLHGLGHDLGYWDADAPVLARHHRVLRCDLRGSGRSGRPAGPWTLADYACDTARFLRALGVSAGAHVVGISMGGVVAQRLALDHPDCVRSLVLVSTSSEVGPQATAMWRRLADAVERDGFGSRLADASRAFAPAFAAAHPDVVAGMTRRNAANDPRAYATAARAVSAYNWTAALAAVAVPVLILQGLDDQLTPPGGAVRMQRALPRARLLLVDGAGHNLPIERPDLFRAAVLAFAAGVDLCQG